ncbi:riboflavin kinase [Williamsia soli]|uniref:riboflavin kinase n=1 Tax=Williamsia soli TaxID=364929 RepID=UPI001A9FDA7A|nr:riboflavin kinase [Williamsia soli]
MNLLGYAAGEIVRGEGRGAPMGYPTANIAAEDESRIPEDGVYFGWFSLADGDPPRGSLHPGTWLPALVSVGENPTFDGRERTVEAYLIDFDEDLYGANAIAELTHLVRKQEQFNSIDELIVAMNGDKASARTLMSQYPTRPQEP